MAKLQPAPVQKIMQLMDKSGNMHPLWRDWFNRLGLSITGGSVGNQSAWSFNNAAARGNNGIINYQTQGVLRGGTYATGTITIGSGNTGLYLVVGAAEVGYNGGISGADGTIEIFQNGAGTGYRARWHEVNNTVEHSTIVALGLLPVNAADTIGIQFTTGSGGNVFSGAGSFVGRYIGT